MQADKNTSIFLKSYDRSDWKNVRLGDIVEYSKGTGLSKEKLSDKGLYRCILYGELFTRYKEIINTVHSKTFCLEGTPSVAGDVLLPGSTTTCGEDLAKASSLNFEDILLGGDIIILRPKKNQVIGDFLSYLIPMYKKDMLKYTQGITIIHLQGKKLLDLTISIPPIDIQKNIVKNIQKIDLLISNLEKLISKQESIKKSTINLLLCQPGNIQLPLSKIASISKGEQLSKDNMDSEGQYIVMNGGVSPSGRTHNYNTSKNTIIISEGGNSCGFVSFIKENFWCGGHCYALSDLSVDIEYLYQILKQQEPQIMGLRIGSGLPNIQKNRLGSFMLSITQDVSKQKAIAQKLGAIDEHISNLKLQLKKQQDLKQGLMQYFFGD